MALQFIFGGSGAGKSYQLYHKIIEESEKHPDENYMVLVPEQFTMQTQKDLVLMSPNRGIMNIDVLSFVRLAHRIFEETGKGQMPILDDEGKSLILRKIAGDSSLELKVLRSNMKKPGYISEVKSVISEFTQYDIGSEELERVMEQVGEDAYLYYKLNDVLLLYERFQQYLKDKYITKEELLDVLCDAVTESELLKNATIVLDGFTGFTPVQNRLLEKLLHICKDVIITVTIGAGEDPYAYGNPYQLFALSKQTVSSLIDITKRNKIPVKDPIYLAQDSLPRFKDAPELAFLEQHLFRYSKQTYGEKPKAVSLHIAKGPKEEAFAVAGEVRRMVREEGWRYREIGVIVSDMDAYADYLEQAFGKYDIPIFTDHKKSILLNAFVEYIRSLLAMVEKNFSYDSVFRFLRTGYTTFSHADIDALENYVLGVGIRGYKRWQEKFLRRLKGMKEEELSYLNHLRVLFVEQVSDLTYILKQRRKTVKDITIALYDFLVKEEMQMQLKQQEETFIKSGELALAKEYAQIYAIVIELFDKFVELLGEEPVSLEEYGKLLDAGLAEAKVGVIPPGVDQVVVGDMQRTRLKDIKALLFVGANDAFLPGALLRTGMLTERDREKFAKEKLNLTPGGKEQAYIQKFYLYLNLTKPTRKLSLYYSKVSGDGKSVRPSYLIQEIQKLYPKLTVIDEEARSLCDQELNAAMAVDELIEGLRMRSETAGSAWMELYTWYKKHPEWAKKIETILSAGFYKKPADSMSEKVAKELYGEEFADSITRMEKFSACAYAHFLSYGLRLKERQEYEFQALDLGNVFHSAIERYAKKTKSSGKEWTNLSREEQKAFVSESVEEAVTDYGNSVLYSSARNEQLITRITKVMNRTVWALTKQLEQGDFKPVANELVFGSGKIDRVDICEDEDAVYVKVIDYKTGARTFDISSLYYGLQLQLMVYMDAALHMTEEKYPNKEVIPSGVFYYRIKDPLVDKVEDKSTLEDKILRELRPDGIVGLEKESLKHLDKRGMGDSLVVPVKFNKDRSLGKTSSTVTSEEFRVMTKYAKDKIGSLHRQIQAGEIKIQPYRQGTRTGCDYCKYKHICGFDEQVPGYRYADIPKLAKEAVIGHMKEKDNEREMD